ncbi:hypothetical protein F4824DRAFT_75048 [Ustulina deusta]|nr:hypothetical protein F4824DRAFT_75048 [Ustulina deusta]
MEPILDEPMINTIRLCGEVRTPKPPSEDAYESMLRIRRAYEADRPLYPYNGINDLLRFTVECNAKPTTLKMYRDLDYFGDEQWWAFSEEQLQSAKIDLSPIQWLITMPFVCSHPEKTLTRAFSLTPMQSIHDSAWRKLKDRVRDVSPDFGAMFGLHQIQKRFVDNRSKWNSSNYKTNIDTAVNNAIAQCFTHDHQPFTKVLVIGAGSLELDIANHLDHGSNNWPSMTQHAFALDLKNTLDGLSHLPTELVLQNPEYTDVTAEVLRLQEPTVRVVRYDTLDAVFGVDDHTLLFAVNCTDFPLKQIIAEHATASPCEQRLPRVIIWEEGVHVTWENMEKMALTEDLTDSVASADRTFRDSPRTNRLEEGYDKFEFPTSEEGDPDPFATKPRLAIYVRKQAPTPNTTPK